MARLPPDAFDAYVALGPARSYQAVASRYGVSKQAVTKRAQKERWAERLAKIEDDARAKTDEKIAESLEAMNTRHLKTLQVIQGKALEGLKGLALEQAMDCVRALEIAIRNERTIRGEPGDRTAVSVEEIIRREYEQWMKRPVENGHGR